LKLDSLLYDVIIVGGGPAGLTAGLYATRARLKSLLIESYFVPTQAVTTTLIENYPGFSEGISGFELIDRFRKQAKGFGLEFAVGEVRKVAFRKSKDIKIWEVVVDEQKYHSLALIIASRAMPKRLGIEGEAEFQGKGVSYCAICDGAFFKDKDIVVVGGGDAAVEETLFLTKFVRKVTVIHRRDKLRATKILQERILTHKKVEFIWNAQVMEILGSQKVEAVKVKDVNTKQELEILCQGVFVFIGLMPNTNFIKEVVKVDEEGYIITDENMKTSRESIFSGGDCRKKLLRQVVTACGDGALAAFSAQNYVERLKGIASNSNYSSYQRKHFIGNNTK